LVSPANSQHLGGIIMSPNTPNTPRDELLERYEQAKTQLPDGLPEAPSAATRERIMQAARVQAETINSIALRADSMPATGLKDSQNTVQNQIPTKEAANDSFWNIKAVASLAVMGLSALLWWQFEQGTPEEQQAAKSALPAAASAPAPVASAPAAPMPAPEPAPAAAPMMRSAPSTATVSPNTDTRQQLNAEAAGSATLPPNAASKSMPSAPIAAARPAAPSAQSILPPAEPLFTAIEQRNALALRQALSQGLSPNARSADSNPVLTQAVMQRWPEGVRILLAAGADRAAKNSKGHTAADVAFELGYEDIVLLLSTPR
jgi:cytoskeletal protein RodZ